MLERVDAHIRKLEELPPRDSQILRGERSSTIFTLNGVRFHFDGSAGRRRERFSTSARTTPRRRVTLTAKRSTSSPIREDLRCIWRASATALLRSIPRGRRSKWPSRTSSSIASSIAAGEIEWIEANAFDLLKDYATAGRQYDTIVLDPPAFAKTKRAVTTAIRGYKELNLRALKMLRPGGILITCSCSFHVSEAEFLEMLGSAAADAGRAVRVFWRSAAPREIIPYC